jgi:hypothetical protein
MGAGQVKVIEKDAVLDAPTVNVPNIDMERVISAIGWQVLGIVTYMPEKDMQGSRPDAVYENVYIGHVKV